VATALSPPPGIQEERAHRAFAVTLCADGVPLAAPARVCFPLAVRNLRPLDAGSLRYRVEAPVPVWVAPWTYDLAVRFPGGEARLAQGVQVVRSDQDLPLPAQLHASAGGYRLTTGDQSARVRLHVGSSGLAVQGARYEPFPLPGENGLRLGFVALVALRSGQTAQVASAPASARPPLSIALGAGSDADVVRLGLVPAPTDGQVFWWLGPDLGGQGVAQQAHFDVREKARVQALWVTSEGRVTRAERLIPLRARRAFGCALGPVGTRSGASSAFVWGVAGLLAVARSRKLARALCRWQGRTRKEPRE
jgi:hypothetical protein